MDFNFIWLVIGLFAVIIYLGIMKRQGRLTETKFAVIVVADWSYFTLSTMHFFSVEGGITYTRTPDARNTLSSSANEAQHDLWG